MGLDAGGIRANVLLDLSKWDETVARLKVQTADVGDVLQKIPDAKPRIKTDDLDNDSKKVKSIADTISEALKKASGGAINVDIHGLEQAGAESESILAKMSAGLLALPVAAAAATAGLVALAGVGTKTLFDLGESFDLALRKLSAATGATEHQTEEFNAQLRQLATAVPENLDTLASQMAIITQRLHETDTELTTSVALFHDWSRATGENAVASTQALTQVFVQWNVAAQDQRHTLDGLKAIMEETGVKAEVLESGLAQLGPIAQLAGLSMAETAAIIARFNQAGVDASSAVFGLRRIIAEAAKEGVTPREEFQRFVDTMKSGAPEAEKLAEAIKILGVRGETLYQSVKSGRFDIDDLAHAFDNASGNVSAAAVKMTDAAKKLEDEWKLLEAAFIPVADTLHLKFDEMAFAFIKSLNDMGAGIDRFLASSQVKGLVDFLAKQGAGPAGAVVQAGITATPLGLPAVAQGAGNLANAAGEVLNPSTGGGGGGGFDAGTALTKAETQALAEHEAKEKADQQAVEEHTKAVRDAETAQARLVAGLVSGIGATTDWTAAITKVLAVMPLGTQATVEQVAAILDAKAATEELAKGEALHDTALAARIIQLQAWAARTTDATEAQRLQEKALQLTRDGLDAQAESEKQASKAKAEHLRITEQLADLETNTYAKALDHLASGVLPTLNAAEAQYVEALKIGKNTKEEAAFLAAKYGVSVDDLNAHIAEGGEKLATWGKQQLAANRALADYVSDEQKSRITGTLSSLEKGVDAGTAALAKQMEASGHADAALKLLLTTLGASPAQAATFQHALEQGGAAAVDAQEKIAALTTYVREHGELRLKIDVDIEKVQQAIGDLQQSFQAANTQRADSETKATDAFIGQQAKLADQFAANASQHQTALSKIADARTASTDQMNAEIAKVAQAAQAAMDKAHQAIDDAIAKHTQAIGDAQDKYTQTVLDASVKYGEGILTLQEAGTKAAKTALDAQIAAQRQLAAAMESANDHLQQTAATTSMALQATQAALYGTQPGATTGSQQQTQNDILTKFYQQQGQAALAATGAADALNLAKQSAGTAADKAQDQLREANEKNTKALEKLTEAYLKTVERAIRDEDKTVRNADEAEDKTVRNAREAMAKANEQFQQAVGQAQLADKRRQEALDKQAAAEEQRFQDEQSRLTLQKQTEAQAFQDAEKQRHDAQAQADKSYETARRALRLQEENLAAVKGLTAALTAGGGGVGAITFAPGKMVFQEAGVDYTKAIPVELFRRVQAGS